jgi:pimeloyl-ACP methyl ester carboxylesterase
MLNIIYIPGLGDKTAYGQQLITHTWRLYGVRARCERMLWAKDVQFAPKLQRLLDRIDELHQQGKEVALVGSSAGASAALVAFAQRQDVIKGVVCLCGKINNPDTIGPAVYAENPAFQLSMREVQKALPLLNDEARQRIMSIHPKQDNTVPIADTIIPGAIEAIIPTAGHSTLD